MTAKGSWVDRPGGRAATVRGGLIVGSAMVVMNVATYLFTALAARALGPTAYGAFAALMALVLVVNVVSVGMQTTAARRSAAAPLQRLANAARIRSVSWRAAGLLFALCLVLAPAVTVALKLDSVVPAVLLAVPAAAFAVMGGQAGLLQGEQQWWPFAAMFASFGVARLVLGAAALALLLSPTGAMLGVALASVVPVIIGTFAMRRDDGRALASRPESDPVAGTESVWREVAHNSHTLFAFFALSGVDVFAARLVLSEHEAGLYAAGLILTKAVLFLPYFVIVVAFPAMSRQGRSGRLHLWGLAVIATMGVFVVTGAWLLPRLALVFVGGAAYGELSSRLWVFALLGTVLAAIQLLVHTALARRHARAVWYIWAAFAGVGAWLMAIDTGAQLLVLVLTVNTVLLGVLAVVTRNDRVDVSQDSPGQ